MPDMTAQKIVSLWEKLRTDQSNARSLWQDTADHIYPYVQIETLFEAGTPRTTYLYDQTPYFDMLDMVSGLKHALIPTGQPFYSIKASEGQLNRQMTVQRYCAYLTEISHEKIMQSNFITEFDEVLRSMIIFGPGDIFSQWTKKTGLNYRASEVGSYVLIEDGYKNVIGSIHKIILTADSAYEQFGDKAGIKIIEAAKDDKKRYDKFEFLHYVMPRKNINPMLSRQYNMNMPYESIYVNMKENLKVEEGGFPENPYHNGRWMRPCHEKDGRGIATELLPGIKVLFQQWQDFIEVGNKWNKPPMETLDAAIEGDIDMSPGARNHVYERDAIRPVNPGLLGNFPITEKTIALITERIDKAFFKNAFAPLEDITSGARMTTLEVRERIRQTFPKLGPPVGRIWIEVLDKLLSRSIIELIRNGEVEKPPPELSGRNFGIEYVGPFALALKSSQARGFQEWAMFVGQMEAVFPGSVDNVDADDAIVRMGHTFGVNVEDIATEDERAAKRQKRAQDEAQMKTMMAIQAGSEAYGKTTKKPEEGSPAALIGAGV